jgi:fatty-acyl-CoA synthase
MGCGRVKIVQDWLRHWSLHSPTNTALFDGETNESWTYSNIWRRSQAGAAFLQEKYSLQKGDRVLYVGQNDLSVISLFFSCARIGAVLVPVNYRLSASEVAYILGDANPRLVVHDDFYEALAKEAHQLSEKKSSSLLALRGAGSFELATQEMTSFPEFHASESDPAMIIYTSGTTGFPKGAMISHGALFWNAVSTSMRLNIVQSDCAVTFLPLFHTGGWNVLTTPFMQRGAKIVLVKKFEPELILQLSQDHKATLLFGVPTTMGMMARTPKFWDYNLSSVRYAIVGGEPMPLELIQTWHDKRILIRQGYGLTEFGPNVFSLNEQDSIRKIGSIGFPNAYIHTQVVKEDGGLAGANEVGELWLQGPACMLGYWHNPKATQETMGDGWLKTGDLVRIDEEGYFYVVGRKKDMFKSGGENVYPAEVEQVISKMKWVQEVAVIGIPDPKWGEVGKAFIVCDESHFSETELREHCSQFLAKFKIPKLFIRITELPKAGSGKIVKKDLPRD